MKENTTNTEITMTTEEITEVTTNEIPKKQSRRSKKAMEAELQAQSDDTMTDDKSSTVDTDIKEEIITDANTTEVVETTEKVLVRANRVSVQSIGEDKYVADFYKTHKHILKVKSEDTDWELDTTLEVKTAIRESFRQYMIDNASKFGIEWDPADKRPEGYRPKPRYTSEDDLYEDANQLIRPDIELFVHKSPHSIYIKEWDITLDGVTPMTKSGKGTDLSLLGIHDGRYGNGNLAWMNIDLSITIKCTDDQEIYIPMRCQLVSGQLKKPSNIGDGKYNQTAWNTEIYNALKEIDLIVEKTENSEESVDEPK